MKKLILTIVITAFAGTSYADTQTFSQIGDEQAFNAALSAIKQHRTQMLLPRQYSTINSHSLHLAQRK